MTDHVNEFILKATGAETAVKIQTVQKLWRGYGDIVRYALTGGRYGSVIVKHVKLPSGLQGDLSHRRKVRSYQVETVWYRDWSGRCDDACRVPACLAADAFGDEVLTVLEDLDAAGFSKRKHSVGDRELHGCLRWLANFHATFLGESPKGLWLVGTYWHLETRPDELNALTDTRLKKAAATIDRRLRESPYQTVVHGDAKLDNFCFAEGGKDVAAVDFQYVGGGPGIKDVAYFLDSCLDSNQCERREKELLDVYFNFLKLALMAKDKAVCADAVEADWRALYPLAWTDFHRFLKGWSPGHWHENSYSERLAREVIAQLKSTEGREDAFVG